MSQQKDWLGTGQPFNNSYTVLYDRGYKLSPKTMLTSVKYRKGNTLLKYVWERYGVILLNPVGYEKNKKPNQPPQTLKLFPLNHLKVNILKYHSDGAQMSWLL